jgi:hypothetical protein
MPFVTEYTPTEALFALAQKAGNAEGLQTGAPLALQYKQIALQERRDLTNAYLQKLSMDNQAKRDASAIQTQQQNFAAGQDAQAFDREKFNKTYDLNLAIEERARQESMTPTQAFQQRLTLEAAKDQARAKAEAEANKREDAKDATKFEQAKILKNIPQMTSSSRTPELENIDFDIKDVQKQHDDAVKSAIDLGNAMNKASDDDKPAMSDELKAIQTKVNVTRATLDALRAKREAANTSKGFGLDSPNAFPQQAIPLPKDLTQLQVGQTYIAPNGKKAKYLGNGEMELID